MEKPLYTTLYEISTNGEFDHDKEYKCYAPKTWDRKWEEWTDKDKAILDKHVSNGLNCEGGLIPSEHYGMCPLTSSQGYGESY